MRMRDWRLLVSLWQMIRVYCLRIGILQAVNSIHFAHRVGALILTVLLVYFVWRLLKHKALDKLFFSFPILISVILSLQVYLGALTIWTAKNPYSATMHHLVGAFLLATVWGITFILSRNRAPEMS